MKFFVMNFFTKDEQIRTADLLAFIKELLNRKTSFFCSVFTATIEPIPCNIQDINSGCSCS